MTTANAMTIELVKILEEAQMNFENGMRSFEASENEIDEELHEIYWAICREYDGKVWGLLKAYEILTGEKIYPHQIKSTLYALA